MSAYCTRGVYDAPARKLLKISDPNFLTAIRLTVARVSFVLLKQKKHGYNTNVAKRVRAGSFYHT